MDGSELRKVLLDEMPGLDGLLATELARSYAATDDDAERLLAIARVIFLRLHRAEKKEGDLLPVGDLFPPSAPWNEIRSEQLARTVAGRVEKARQQIERQAATLVSLPMDDYSKAVEWLLEEERLERSDASGRKPQLSRKPVSELTEQELKAFKRALATEISAAAVPYSDGKQPPPDGRPWTQRAVALPGGALYALAMAASEIATATGFDEVAVVAWILADVAPLLRPVEVRSIVVSLPPSDGGASWRKEITITFRTPEIGFEQLRSIHGRLRRFWGEKKWKAITADDRRLWEAVRKRGPPDRGEGRKFWRAVAEEIGAPSGEAVRQKWGRLDKKLQELDEPPPRLWATE